jgi:hypothetical protein
MHLAFVPSKPTTSAGSGSAPCALPHLSALVASEVSLVTRFSYVYAWYHGVITAVGKNCVCALAELEVLDGRERWEDD